MRVFRGDNDQLVELTEESIEKNTVSGKHGGGYTQTVVYGRDADGVLHGPFFESDEVTGVVCPDPSAHELADENPNAQFVLEDMDEARRDRLRLRLARNISRQTHGWTDGMLFVVMAVLPGALPDETGVTAAEIRGAGVPLAESTITRWMRAAPFVERIGPISFRFTKGVL